MTEATFNAVLLLTPAAIGGVVAALNREDVNDTTERLEGWVRGRQQRAATAGRVGRYALNPPLWAVTKFCDWTDDFPNRGLKSGVRVAAALYLGLFWAFLVWTLIKIMVFLAIAAVVIVVGFKMLVNADPDIRRGYEAGRNAFGGDSGSDRGSRGGGSLFASECSSCGSTEHATRDCPHGIFSSECGSCGSRNHSTADCPHGILSSACGSCGSKDHRTGDCPHGIFSSECGSCGSKSHRTGDCPHGIFSTKCASCGSVDHATRDCPH